MAFNLQYTIELAEASKKIFDSIIEENKDKKDVSVHDTFELLAQAAMKFAAFQMNDGKPLDVNQQKQLLCILYNTLVQNESNGFEEDNKLNKVIDTVMQLRDGNFEVDFGKKGYGCLPCTSVKISARK